MRSFLALFIGLTACSSSANQSTEPGTSPPTARSKDDAAAISPLHSQDLTSVLLGELATAARCDEATSPFRPWCIPATGWANATADSLPTGATVLVGFTIELEQGKSAGEALTNRVTFSALALRTDGDKTFGKITMVKPESDQESQMVAEALAGASAVFKGKAQLAVIPADLTLYLSTLPAKADYPIENHEGGWTWSGESSAELRRSGEYWITIEKPSQGRPGIFVSVFTDKISK